MLSVSNCCSNFFQYKLMNTFSYKGAKKIGEQILIIVGAELIDPTTSLIQMSGDEH